MVVTSVAIFYGCNEQAAIATSAPIDDEVIEPIFKMNQKHILNEIINFFQPFFYPKKFPYLPFTSLPPTFPHLPPN
jgi:hypothetical protein